MHFHLPIIANHNKLAATVNQMKSTPSNFSGKNIAANFMLHIAHCTAHNSTAQGCLGLK